MGARLQQGVHRRRLVRENAPDAAELQGGRHRRRQRRRRGRVLRLPRRHLLLVHRLALVPGQRLQVLQKPGWAQLQREEGQEAAPADTSSSSGDAPLQQLVCTPRWHCFCSCKFTLG